MNQKLLIIANCQAPILARFMNAIAPGVRASYIVAQGADVDKASKYMQRMRNSDAILHFDISDSFFCKELTTSFIKSEFPDKSHVITNIYFSGLHPDATYVGRMNKRLQGPFGDYHSKICIAGFELGLPAQTIADIVFSEDAFQSLGYGEEFHSSAETLRARDARADIKYADRLIRHMLNATLLPLYTLNHPASFVLLDYAKFLLAHLDLPFEDVPSNLYPDTLQRQTVIPVLPQIAKRLDLNYSLQKWKRPGAPEWYDYSEAVDLFYKTYEDKGADFGHVPGLKGIRELIREF